MFKAKQLNKLVKAGIISADQEKQILAYDDGISGGFVMRALNLLGIFTIGIGVISLVASNWEYLGDNLKLIVMFALLFGAAEKVILYKQKGFDVQAEKCLVLLFLLVGAAIGLVIQVYHLSGDIWHLPVAFWWVTTLPLLFAAKKKYVAWFWVPLFLAWCAMYAGERYWRDLLDTLLVTYAAVFAGGWTLSRCKPDFAAGAVLERDAFFAFYLVLAFYILSWNLSNLIIGGLILFATSVVYYCLKDYRKVRLNIKFAGLWVFSLYIYLGGKIGLFGTGIGLIVSGGVLIALIKVVSRISKQVTEEKKNA